MEFSNLNVTDNLVAAYKTLKGVPGIYCILNVSQERCMWEVAQILAFD